MLLILLGLLLWMPAVLGWGAWWVLVRRTWGGGGAEAIDVLEPLAGLASLAALANVVNLFVPLTPIFTTVVLATGWLLAGWRLARLPRRLFSPGAVGLGVGWLLAVAVLANDAPRHYDAGLYYLQTIDWFRQSATPLGLANLHGRLGFNSAWHSLAAVLELPLWTGRTGTSAYILSPMLGWFFGLTAILAITRLRAQAWTRSTLFMAASSLVVWSGTWHPNLSSQAPDLPILFLTLIAVYVALQLMERQIDSQYGLIALAFITVFAITIKLSAAPLLLLPVAMVWWASRQRVRLDLKRLAGYAVVFALMIGVPWLIRGVLLSGCLAYPVAATCVFDVPWRVAASQAVRETLWIQAWARQPMVEAEAVMASWDWFGQWLVRASLTSDAVICASMLLLSAWLRVRLPIQTPSDDNEAMRLRWIYLPLLGCLAFWFWSAPDVRFGAGYLWAAALLALASSFHHLRRHSPPNPVAHPRALRRLRLGRAVLVEVLAMGLIWFIIQGIMPQLGSASQQWLLQWPQPVAALTSTQLTRQGQAITVPRGTDQCWLAALPCTPYFDANLELEWTIRRDRVAFQLP